ncbi:MAG: hypothetical protein K2R98_33025 [Gemmataceae bacterium]|nr:hypothetical protein [Gemmataceae bacterium]
MSIRILPNSSARGPTPFTERPRTYLLRKSKGRTPEKTTADDLPDSDAEDFCARWWPGENAVGD